jgi:hypothetical protein
MTFALLFCFNFFIIVNILQHYDVKWVEDFYKRRTLFIFGYLILVLIGYITFIKNNKHLKIKYKYDKEERNKKRLKTVLALFYITMTIILLFIF